MIDDLRRMQEQLAGMPEPIAYLVLDHELPAGGYEEGSDWRGRRYVRCSPSVMDAARHVKSTGRFDDPAGWARALGVPVHRREDLPEGWPCRP